jgi:hypothetical protein
MSNKEVEEVNCLFLERYIERIEGDLYRKLDLLGKKIETLIVENKKLEDRVRDVELTLSLMIEGSRCSSS